MILGRMLPLKKEKQAATITRLWSTTTTSNRNKFNWDSLETFNFNFELDNKTKYNSKELINYSKKISL